MMKKSSPEEIEKLLSQVIPTPTVSNSYTDAQKIELIEKKFAEIMEVLGLDLQDDSLAATPHRVAKMYVKELFSGLNSENFPRMTTVENKMGYDQMVVVQDIEVLSCCEHHFQTIEGVATIAYIPGDKVLGLSKLSRVVSFFARRPQVQERLTKQIADCLQVVLGNDDVAVHINAKHYCMIARGVQESRAATVTSDLRGAFKTCAETRQEFLLHCYHGRTSG